MLPRPSPTRLLRLSRTTPTLSRPFSTPYLFPLVSSTKRAVKAATLNALHPSPSSPPPPIDPNAPPALERGAPVTEGGAPPPPPPPPGGDKDPRGIWSRSPVLRIVTRLCFSSILGLTVLTGVLLLHDASTYGTSVRPIINIDT